MLSRKMCNFHKFSMFENHVANDLKDCENM